MVLKMISRLRLMLALLLAVPALGLPSCQNQKTKPEAFSVVKEESFFSDFAVRNDRVYFLCYLTLRNPSEGAIAVQLTGDFAEDVKGGLLTKRELRSCQVEDSLAQSFQNLSGEELEAATFWTYAEYQGADVFLVPPGGKSFWVLFIGEHGTAESKQNRLLPPITVHPLADVTPAEVLEETGCHIFKKPGPDHFDAFLLDGEHFCVLGCLGMGGYGFTSAVPWDYDFDGVTDLVFTYSWGSGIHRSHLAVFDRNSREERDLFVYYPRDYDPSVLGSDLLVERVTDERGAASCAVYTADVIMDGWNYADLRFTRRAKAGEVHYVLSVEESSSGPIFWPDEDFHGLTDMPEAVPEIGTAEPDEEPDAHDGQEEGDAVDAIQLPDAASQGCTVSFDGVRIEVDSETAAELYRICREATEQGEALFYWNDTEWKGSAITLIFRSWSNALGSTWEGPWFSISQDDACMTGGSPYASNVQRFQLPAGTCDALKAVLTRNGTLSASPGERVEGSEINALFEKDGLYTVQLYDRSGALVWAYGPSSRRPEVKQEEPGLWSVSVQAGTGIGTRWTVYYAPEEGRISRAWYGVLDRQGELLVHPASGTGLRICELFSDGISGTLLTPSQPLAPAAEPFVAAQFTEDGKGVTVTYLSGSDYHEVTETLPLP